jgi:hypothetical protein
MQSSPLAKILRVEKGVEDLTPKIEAPNQDVPKVRADQRLVRKRIDALEADLA